MPPPLFPRHSLSSMCADSISTGRKHFRLCLSLLLSTVTSVCDSIRSPSSTLSERVGHTFRGHIVRRDHLLSTSSKKFPRAWHVMDGGGRQSGRHIPIVHRPRKYGHRFCTKKKVLADRRIHRVFRQGRLRTHRPLTEGGRPLRLPGRRGGGLRLLLRLSRVVHAVRLSVPGGVDVHAVGGRSPCGICVARMEGKRDRPAVRGESDSY